MRLKDVVHGFSKARRLFKKAVQRCENDAGGLFQQPARKLPRYCPMYRITRIKTAVPRPHPLTAIYIGTHNTNTFRFGLPADATLDLLPGYHLYVHAIIDGKSLSNVSTGPRLCRALWASSISL